GLDASEDPDGHDGAAGREDHHGPDRQPGESLDDVRGTDRTGTILPSGDHTCRGEEQEQSEEATRPEAAGKKVPEVSDDHQGAGSDDLAVPDQDRSAGGKEGGQEREQGRI